jgi:hypothetical protein
MTREHVFAHWLIARLHASRLAPSYGEPSTMRISRVVARVCADCNAGWMSGLEVGFRRTVFTRQRAGVLRPPERTTLSRWFTKSAVLLADALGVPLGATEQRPLLRTAMPEDIEVFLARRRRPPQALDFALTAPAGDQTRAVAIAVGDLVGHVALRGTLGSAHGTRLWPLRTHTLRWETLPVIARLLVGLDEEL